MGKTKELLEELSKEELSNMEIVYEIIGAERDDR